MAIPLFDAHCDTLSRLLAEPEPAPAGEWRPMGSEPDGGIGPTGQIFAAFADSALPGAVEQAARQIALFHRECRLFSDRIAPCTNGGRQRKRSGTGEWRPFYRWRAASC